VTNTKAILSKLHTLRADLIAISLADRLYGLQQIRSQEDCPEYQRRQERVNEIRLQIYMLGHDNIQ
jgi:hypothetical protein